MEVVIELESEILRGGDKTKVAFKSEVQVDLILHEQEQEQKQEQEQVRVRVAVKVQVEEVFSAK